MEKRLTPPQTQGARGKVRPEGKEAVWRRAVWGAAAGGVPAPALQYRRGWTASPACAAATGTELRRRGPCCCPCLRRQRGCPLLASKGGASPRPLVPPLHLSRGKTTTLRAHLLQRPFGARRSALVAQIQLSAATSNIIFRGGLGDMQTEE